MRQYLLMNNSGLNLEEEFRDNILNNIKKVLTTEEALYICTQIKEHSMQKITGERIKDLYEETAGQFDDTSSRFAFIADVLNKENETNLLKELISACESQLNQLQK